MRQLQTLGINVTKAEVDMLYKKYDRSGRNLLSLTSPLLSLRPCIFPLPRCAEPSFPSSTCRNHAVPTGSGLLSFQELLQAIVPKDYTRPAWNIVRDHQLDKLEKTRVDQPPVINSWPAALAVSPGPACSGAAAVMK